MDAPPYLPPFVVHVKPVGVPQPDYGARHVTALVLIVEPRSQHRVDPDLVARTLGLTPMESQVAAGLAEGKSVRDMAEATRRTQGSIYWNLKQIYQKQPVSRQADLGAAGAVDRRVRFLSRDDFPGVAGGSAASGSLVRSGNCNGIPIFDRGP